jgi:hypothetical protein
MVKLIPAYQVNGGSQSFNTVNTLRILGRWMRMIVIPNQVGLLYPSCYGLGLTFAFLIVIPPLGLEIIHSRRPSRTLFKSRSARGCLRRVGKIQYSFTPTQAALGRSVFRAGGKEIEGKVADSGGEGEGEGGEGEGEGGEGEGKEDQDSP